MKIRTRIFLFFVLVIAIGIFALVRWMQGEMRPRYLEAQEDTLVDLSQLLASQLSANGIKRIGQDVFIDTSSLSEAYESLATRKIDAKIYELHKQRVDVRVYVTDARGRVIFDSDGGRDLNQDYSQWRDVNRTLRGEYGARSTQLDPLFPQSSTMYIAAPLHFEDQIVGVLSVGKPTRNAERFLAHLLNKLGTVALIIVGIAVVITLIVNRWLSRPLARLQHYANAVTRGEPAKLPTLGKNEVGEVGQALESMRVALEGKDYVADYVQSLTHELKSPIAAIQGASELLSEDLSTEDRIHFLNNIRTEAERMQELIERLLELAALEYRPDIEFEDQLSVKHTVADVVESMAPLAEQKKVKVVQSIEQDHVFRGDRFLFTKAILNVLKNALEFSPADSTVDIKFQQTSGSWNLSICDTGPGVPDYARGRIFERFFSLPRENGRKGTGLGMSFVKEIAALHAIDVQISDNPSAQGQGTCVSFTFTS